MHTVVLCILYGIESMHTRVCITRFVLVFMAIAYTRVMCPDIYIYKYSTGTVYRMMFFENVIFYLFIFIVGVFCSVCIWNEKCIPVLCILRKRVPG